MARRLSYYEGPFPGPGTEMLVTSVSTLTGGSYPTIYLSWQAVQFTVRIKRAVGRWLLSDVLSEIPGCKVIVDIDSVDDTVYLGSPVSREQQSRVQCQAEEARR